jgi:hypothetical protein
MFISQVVFWVIYIHYDQLPPQIPLWNLQPWGASQLAPLRLIWVLPGFSILMLCVHLLITAFIQRKKPYVVGFLMGFTVVVNIFVLVATFRLLGHILGWI